MAKRLPALRGDDPAARRAEDGGWGIQGAAEAEKIGDGDVLKPSAASRVCAEAAALLHRSYRSGAQRRMAGAARCSHIAISTRA